MAESSTPADGVVAEEARQQEAGQGNSEDSRGLQDTKEQGVRKGKTTLESTELMREDLVQSAVSFLKHPKVAASSDGQRRSFLENKGLTLDEIDEAFRRLQSPSSDSASLNTCTSQGVSDHSSRITQQETKVGTKCMDGSERVAPGTEPVVPRHPKSYMEDINDDPPNPDQPISEPRMAPKPKPWEKQDQGSLGWDLKPPAGDSSISPRTEAQHDGTSSKATDSADASKQGDPLLQAEVAVSSESTATDHTASSLE
ncbi:hypothetical protein U9M48_044957 [Paspalum notatum var. saurae]|uniref:Peroxisomal membrane protein PEX14 n=1 Tax=Paspalum notatum var. saurae TaxID=547442 RepID=A0AAQ3V0B8_PASNO